MSTEGRWHIVDMELWDREAIDLLGPAFIEIGPGHNGRFRFIAVEGWMDTRAADRDGTPGIEFSWEGMDESDGASGRGWATLSSDGSLTGRIYFHGGDDSSFRATREVTEDRPNLGADADRSTTNNQRDFPSTITEIGITYPIDLPEPSAACE